MGIYIICFLVSALLATYIGSAIWVVTENKARAVIGGIIALIVYFGSSFL